MTDQPPDENYSFFASGQILDADPLSLRGPTTLHFQSMRIIPGKEGNFWNDQLNLAGQIILGLHLVRPEGYFIIGSAVIVAPGIALTATHVLRDDFEHLSEGKSKVIAVGFNKNDLIFWKIRSIQPVLDTDLTIISLQLASNIPDNSRFEVPIISTRVPEADELVGIVGFRQSETWKGEQTLRSSSEIINSAGLRGDYFPDGRPPMVGGPHIGVRCNTPSGVSGGGAFDRDGNLIGILSSSIEHEDGMGPSWVSLLWPAIPVPVPLYWMVEEPGAQKASLLDMKHGFCNLLERDHMTKVVDPETKAITFTIRASAFGEENTGASG